MMNLHAAPQLPPGQRWRGAGKGPEKTLRSPAGRGRVQRGQQLYPRRSWLAAGRGLSGLQVDPEAMLMAAVQLADHNT